MKFRASVAIDDGFYSLSMANAPTAVLTFANNPAITNLMVGSTLNLTFPTEVGPRYVVEWKGALTNGAWNLLTTNVGNGSGFTVSVDPTNAQEFFRLRMQ